MYINGSGLATLHMNTEKTGQSMRHQNKQQLSIPQHLIQPLHPSALHVFCFLSQGPQIGFDFEVM